MAKNDSIVHTPERPKSASLNSISGLNGVHRYKDAVIRSTDFGQQTNQLRIA